MVTEVRISALKCFFLPVLTQNSNMAAKTLKAVVAEVIKYQFTILFLNASASHCVVHLLPVTKI